MNTNMKKSMKINFAAFLITAGLAFATAQAADAVKPYTLKKCFMSGHDFEDKPVEFDYQGQHVKLCCNDCKGDFDKDPAKWMTKLAAALQPFQNANVEQFEKLRADKKNVVLDVRTKKEFDAGHIPGAVNIDVNASDFQEKVAKLDKSKTYLVHCAAGGRSVTACKKLAPAGFERLVNLEGGYKAWEKAGNKGDK
jgi:phage shock protein E